MPKRALTLNSAECIRQGSMPSFSGCGTPALRQWLLFPGEAHAGGRTRLMRQFRMLLETSSRNLLFVSVRSRTVPDLALATQMADLVGRGDPYMDQQRTICQLEELGRNATLLQEPVDQLDSWLQPSIISEVVMVQAVASLEKGAAFDASGRQRLIEDLRVDLSARLEGFFSRLDQPILEMSRKVEGECCCASYNYLSDSESPDGTGSRNRMQATVAFPILLPRLMNRAEMLPIRFAIDEASPLVDALAAHFDVPKSAIKILRHQHAEIVGIEWTGNLKSLTRLLTDIQPEFRPKNQGGWNDFNAAVKFITDITKRSITSVGNRQWLRMSARNGYRILEADREEMDRIFHQVDAFGIGLRSAVRAEILLSGKAVDDVALIVAADALMSALDPSRYIDMAHRWRITLLKEEEKFAEESRMLKGLDWIGILQEPFVTPTRTIHALTSIQDLQMEGIAMKHCVGGYVTACQNGRSQIWSLRQISGRRASTLETAITFTRRGVPEIRIVQHQGYEDTTPETECKVVAQALLSHLRQNPESLKPYLEWNAKVADTARDRREILAGSYPYMAAAREVLPKSWPLERLVKLALEAGRQAETATRAGGGQR